MGGEIVDRVPALRSRCLARLETVGLFNYTGLGRETFANAVEFPRARGRRVGLVGWGGAAGGGVVLGDGLVDAQDGHPRGSCPRYPGHLRLHEGVNVDDVM
eukprot:3924633-Pyramimonas_sp.AAC.1